jgi:hypothetical protein
VGEVSEGLGEAVGSGIEMEFKFERFFVKLLFEQGVENDGRGAGIFEAADSGDFVGKRRSGGD